LVAYLLVEVDVLEDLESLVVVTQQGVQAEQANQGEVAQHLVQGLLPELPGNTVRVTWRQRQVRGQSQVEMLH